jgi:hypothetical protein
VETAEVCLINVSAGLDRCGTAPSGFQSFQSFKRGLKNKEVWLLLSSPQTSSCGGEQASIGDVLHLAARMQSISQTCQALCRIGISFERVHVQLRLWTAEAWSRGRKARGVFAGIGRISPIPRNSSSSKRVRTELQRV